jgi:NitT/TauT family transport system ATP-binding protein
MSAAPQIVEIKGVSKSYKSAGGPVHALEGVSLDVARGEFVSLIGPSGCGKSTLIKIVGDLLEPSAGSVVVDGMTPREARLKRLTT